MADFGSGFSSAFGAVAGTMQRHREMALRQPFSDAQELENQATREMRDAARANAPLIGGPATGQPAAGSPPAGTPPVQGQTPQADTPDAVARLAGSNLGNVTGAPQMQPGQSIQLADQAPRLVQDIQAQTGGTGRANWNQYIERMTEAAMRTGNQQIVTRALANLEGMRQAGMTRGLALAAAAGQAGDARGMANGLNYANQFLPDGFSNQFSAGENGITLTRTPESGGGQPTTVTMTLQQAQQHVMAMMDPKWQQEYLLNTRRFDENVRQFDARHALDVNADSRAAAAERRTDETYRGGIDFGNAQAGLEAQRRRVAELESAAARGDPEARTRLVAARDALERAQELYDRAGARAGTAAVTAREAVGNARQTDREQAATLDRQREANAARVAEETAQRAVDRAQTPDDRAEALKALDAARARRAQAESGLNLSESNAFRATDDRARGLDIREEGLRAQNAVREARLQLQNARNEAERAEAQRRLDIAQQNADTLRMRASQQRTGMSPENISRIGREAGEALDSIPNISTPFRNGDGTSPRDVLMNHAGDFAAANPNVPVSALMQAMAPYIMGTRAMPADALNTRSVTVGGKPIMLPDSFVQDLQGRVSGRAGSGTGLDRPAARSAPSSEGELSRMLSGRRNEPSERQGIRNFIDQTGGAPPAQPRRTGSHQLPGSGGRSPTDDEILRAMR